MTMLAPGHDRSVASGSSQVGCLAANEESRLDLCIRLNRVDPAHPPRWTT